MNETKLKGSVYWRASEKAFDTPHYPDLRSWCLCISKTGPEYAGIPFTGYSSWDYLVPRNQNTHWKMILIRSNLGVGCSVAVESSFHLVKW